jgi:hypothetical protein
VDYGQINNRVSNLEKREYAKWHPRGETAIWQLFAGCQLAAASGLSAHILRSKS